MSLHEKVVVDDHLSAVSSLTAYDDDKDSSRKVQESSLPWVQLDSSLPLARIAPSPPQAGGEGIVAVKELAQGSMLGGLLVRVRLWRIASRVRMRDRMPTQFYRDLLEMSRLHPSPCSSQELCRDQLERYRHSRGAVYGDGVQRKAWSLICRLLVMGQPHDELIVGHLLTFRRSDIQDFVFRVACESSPGLGSSTPPLYPLVSTVDSLAPSRFLNDLIPFSEFCTALLSPLSVRAPQGDNVRPVCTVINTLARITPLQRHVVPNSSKYNTTCTLDPTSLGCESSWELPPFANCLLKYLTSTQTEQQDVVDIVLYLIRIYTEQASHIHPATIVKDGMHPLMPYIHFSIHLAYHSEAAATLFIKNGLLHLIGQLWLHDFPDPHGPGLLSDTKQSIRMDMRAGCILLLGALSRHHPSARELAEYLLSLNTTSSASLCDEKMSVILRSSKSIYYYAGIHTLASHSSPDEFMVIPSLTLFLMEVCVVNGRPLASSEHPFGNPWLSLLTLLSRVETSEYCCTLKDTATRIILWCVSSSDEHWFSLLEALYSVSGKHSTITAFYYIIHHFLSSRDPKMISEENQDVLRRMYRTAVPTPTLKLTNPVDRFVCLLRQGILSYSLFGLMLCNVGASRLVESVMLGSYDFLGGETPSAGERQARIVVCTDVLQKLEIFGKRDEIPLDMRVSHQAFLSKT